MKTCEWCQNPYAAGDGDWGRAKSGRYAQRPGRFCSQKCSYMAWQIDTRRLSPEQSALRLLQRNHRAEFDRLLTEQVDARADSAFSQLGGSGEMPPG